MLRYILCFCFFCFVISFKAQSDKKIIGDSLINSDGVRYYSVNANLATIDWIILPKTAGTIVKRTTDSIAVLWAKNQSANATFAKLGAMVTYPNADNTFNCMLNISIQPQQLSKVVVVNNLFSKQSADSLRFYFKVICDTSTNKRLVLLKDSSFNKTLYTSVEIRIKQKNKIISQSKNNMLSVRLQPGLYDIELLKQTNNGQVKLIDSIRVFSGIRPSLKVSMQTPCCESPITFSITNKNLSKTIGSTFYFGNGEFSSSQSPEKNATYTYPASDGLMSVFMSKVSLTDAHGCTFESEELPISVQKNKFTLFNNTIISARKTLNFPGDTINIKCLKGPPMSMPNPNTPYTYQWNTGQKEPAITVKNPGTYSVWLTDKFGCISPRIGPIEIKQTYKLSEKITVTGPIELKPGQKAMYTITSTSNNWHQFKFIFNDQQSLTLEPTREKNTTLPNYENSVSGKLKVIAYTLNDNKQTLSSDTLNVLIR